MTWWHGNVFHIAGSLWGSSPVDLCKVPYGLHHHDIIKWKHFPRYWPFVWGIHRSPVNSPHKGQWRVALMFSLICVWINGWVNNGEAGDLRCYLVHYGITVMIEPMRHNELHFTYCSLTDGFNSKWAGDINLCFIYCSPEQVLKQTVELPVIWDAMMLMWHLYNDLEWWNHRVDRRHLHCVCRSRFCGWHGYHSGSFKYRLPWWYRLYSIWAFSTLSFGSWIFPDYTVIMADDALAPCVSKSSEAMILAVLNM